MMPPLRRSIINSRSAPKTKGFLGPARVAPALDSGGDRLAVKPRRHFGERGRRVDGHGDKALFRKFSHLDASDVKPQDVRVRTAISLTRSDSCPSPTP